MFPRVPAPDDRGASGSREPCRVPRRASPRRRRRSPMPASTEARPRPRGRPWRPDPCPIARRWRPHASPRGARTRRGPTGRRRHCRQRPGRVGEGAAGSAGHSMHRMVRVARSQTAGVPVRSGVPHLAQMPSCLTRHRSPMSPRYLGRVCEERRPPRRGRVRHAAGVPGTQRRMCRSRRLRYSNAAVTSSRIARGLPWGWPAITQVLAG